MVNPGIRILHLDGEVLAGLITRSQMMKILDVDLLLLELFAKGARVSDVLQEVQHGPSRQLLAADLTAQGLMNKIQTLFQAGMLIRPQLGMARPSSDARPIQCCHNTHAGNPPPRAEQAT